MINQIFIQFILSLSFIQFSFTKKNYKLSEIIEILEKRTELYSLQYNLLNTFIKKNFKISDDNFAISESDRKSKKSRTFNEDDLKLYFLPFKKEKREEILIRIRDKSISLKAANRKKIQPILNDLQEKMENLREWKNVFEFIDENPDLEIRKFTEESKKFLEIKFTNKLGMVIDLGGIYSSSAWINFLERDLGDFWINKFQREVKAIIKENTILEKHDDEENKNEGTELKVEPDAPIKTIDSTSNIPDGPQVNQGEDEVDNFGEQKDNSGKSTEEVGSNESLKELESKLQAKGNKTVEANTESESSGANTESQSGKNQTQKPPKPQIPLEKSRKNQAIKPQEIDQKKLENPLDNPSSKPLTKITENPIKDLPGIVEIEDKNKPDNTGSESQKENKNPDKNEGGMDTKVKVGIGLGIFVMIVGIYFLLKNPGEKSSK